MTSLFARPELLSAYAVAEDGTGPDLPFGTHLRVFAGLGASFPLAPLAVFKVHSRPSEPRSVHVADRAGQRQPDLDLSRLGLADVILGLRDDDTERTIRLAVDDPEGRLEGAAVLGPRGTRFGAVRDRSPWLFSLPLMHRLRLWGASSQLGFTTRSISVDDLERSHDLAAVIGLPIEGDHAWYAQGQPRGEAEGRVERGAPQRLGPLDKPDGQSVSASAAEELHRVNAMLTSGQLGGGLEGLLAGMVDDRRPPWEQDEEQPMAAPHGRAQLVRAPRLGIVQTAALDPGIARFLGFGTQIDDLPDLDGAGGWDTLAVIGLLALDPHAYLRRGMDLTPLLYDPATHADVALGWLIEALWDASGHDPRAAVAERIEFARSEGLVAAPFITAVAPVPAPLPPDLPNPQIVDHRWEPSTDGAPSTSYRASFAFPDPPVAGVAALAAWFDGRWHARHEAVEVPDSEFGRRSVPRVLGYETDPAARVRQQGSGSLEPAGLLADKGIPDIGAIGWRAWAGDMFGRFGNPTEFTLEAPPRPAPPPPVLRYRLERAVVDPASTAELSPGVLRLTVATPHTFPAARFTQDEESRLGTAVVVPRIDDLAAGSLQIARLSLGLDDEPPETVDVSEPGFAEVTLTLPALAPQEFGRWTLTGHFTDSAGVKSAVAKLPIEATDTRPPQVYPAGIGLFWTSPPGPAPEVELMLTWPAPSGSLHRVYLTDQQGLGLLPHEIAEPLPGVTASRGRVAAAGCQRVLAGGPVDRRAFRLLTDQPVKAGPNGANFVTRLPRSLQTVQFLRIVPLGPDGAEPPFDRCGIVPVAVPDGSSPPPPRVSGEVDPATGVATLHITTDGFDRAALQRDEPGLFEPGAAGVEPPQFRLRRAVGAVADPLYARVVGEGFLTPQDVASTPAAFTGSFNDDNAARGLEPFVRYVYWAQVRLPAERRVPAGFAVLDPPNGITVADPLARQPHPRPLSLPSAPRVLMHLPPDPPAPPAAETVTVERGPGAVGDEVQLTLTIADPPRAHALAIGPYRAAIWFQWEGRSIEPSVATGSPWPEIAGDTVVIAVPVPAGVDPSTALKLRLGFVDPAGRLGDLISLDC